MQWLLRSQWIVHYYFFHFWAPLVEKLDPPLIITLHSCKPYLYQIWLRIKKSNKTCKIISAISAWVNLWYLLLGHVTCKLNASLISQIVTLLMQRILPPLNLCNSLIQRRSQCLHHNALCYWNSQWQNSTKVWLNKYGKVSRPLNSFTQSDIGNIWLHVNIFSKTWLW